MLGQHLQLRVEHAQALHRRLVGLDVVNADLQIFQSGVVELHNALWPQQVAVRDQTRDHPAGADVANQVIQLRMQHGLATTQRDDAHSKIGQRVSSLDQHVEWNR